MIIKIQNKVNFNFHKVQKKTVTQLLSGRLNKIANFAKKKVMDTFTKERDITGKRYAKLAKRYKEEFKDNPNKRIMDDSGALKGSIKKSRVLEDLSIAIGTPLEDYENHLTATTGSIKRSNGVFPGFYGKHGKVPQRKFFYTSDEEAYKILENKIETEVNSFLDDLLRNLSTSMRKLS